VDAKTGLRVWAEQFDRPLNDVFAVQDEITSEVVSRLRGGLVTHAAGLRPSRRTSTEVFDLYLGAMSKVYARKYQPALEAREMLQRAVELDPKYAPAWLGLILAGFTIDQTNPAGQNLLPPEEYDRWHAYAKRALALDPQLPDAHAWLGRLESERFQLSGGRPDLLLRGARRAIELDPNNYWGWHESGRALNQLCRRKESVDAWERARALEPLLETAAFNEVQVLTLAGRTGDADRVWRDFRNRSHKPYPILGQMVELDRIDSSQAVIHGLAARAADPGNPMVGWWLAVPLNALGYRDRALQFLPDDQRRTIGAYWSGDFSAAASQMAQIRTLSNWSQLRTAAVLRSLHRTGRHDQLVRLIEGRFGSVSNYIRSRCGVPFQAGLISVAFRRAGRSVEADQLLAAEKAGWAAERKFGPITASLHVSHAEALLLGGDRNGALSELEYATARGWTGHFSPQADLQDPNFDPIRKHPRFKAVERRIAQTQARERRELAAAGVRV
jgi:tetratricopeptide (TPR) repeat protein